MQTVVNTRRALAQPFFLIVLLLAAAHIGWAQVTTVNAASFNADRNVSPDTIVAAFGTFNTQNNQAHTANTLPLPTNLGGVRVRVNNVDAGLFFAAPGQVNFLIPSNVPDGASINVTVTNANNATTSGTIVVRRNAPGIFTAKATGQGVAAALTTFDGAVFQAVFDAAGNEVPVSAGTRAQPNILVLYGTGIRNVPAANPNDGNGVAESVSVRFQGVPGTVLFAGPQGGFSGLDQINVAIPPELAGLGSVNVVVRVGDRDANVVTIRLGGDTPPVLPQVVSFGQTINGALTADDQVQRGDGGNTFFFDAYEFVTMQANTSVAIDLRSPDFDTTVLLYRVNGDQLNLVAVDDQSGGYGAPRGTNNNNALLMTVIQTPGRYVAFATSADTVPNATGNYTFRVVDNIAQQLTFGQTVQGSITTSDLKTSADTYLDVYWFNGAMGENTRTNLNSSVFNAFLILHRNDGDPFITFDDDGGGGTNAQVTYRLAAAGIYLIIATPLSANVTGAYTLSFNRLTGFGAETDDEPAQLFKLPGRELHDARGLAPVPSIERYGTRRIVAR